jgi:tRNA threonylcarbamoyladenosine biosynthesis protein TsaE
MSENEIISTSPDETFEIGSRLGAELRAGDVVLLTGGLGAGKTLLTKGVLSAIGYDVDEVTSPSFTLVNLYETERFNVYHIDLWRSDGGDAAFAVGLDEIVEDENGIVIIEWADRLGTFHFRSRIYRIDLAGDGDEPRQIRIKQTEQAPAANV